MKFLPKRLREQIFILTAVLLLLFFLTPRLFPVPVQTSVLASEPAPVFASAAAAAAATPTADGAGGELSTASAAVAAAAAAAASVFNFAGSSAPYTPPRFAAECAKVLGDLKPNDGCHRAWDKPACLDGSLRFMGQFNQDYYLYMTHFRYLETPGFFLDVAAADPIVLSNTWVYEECLGWEGLCVDGNPKYVNRLKQIRSCQLVPTCVSDVEGETVSYLVAEGLSGVIRTNKNVGLDWGTNQTLVCTTMRRQLDIFGIHHAHYMSLDVEGHELTVLQGMDWDKIAIDVITVEVRDSTLPSLQEFLGALGYERHMPSLAGFKVDIPGYLGEDVIFVHRDVTLGQPDARRNQIFAAEADAAAAAAR